MNTHRARTIGYWLATSIIALEFTFSGAFSIARPPVVIAGLAHLGYPPYFAALLGTWKLLGVIAILAPRFPRLKEWAYAGILFDLSSAAVSHAASGDGAANVVTPLVLAGIAGLSWLLRSESRTLGTIGVRRLAAPRIAVRQAA